MRRRWSAEDRAALVEIAGRVGGHRAAADEWNRTHAEQLSPDAITSALRRANVSRETIRPISFNLGRDAEASRAALCSGRENRPPAIHTSKTRAEGFLIISDLQIPYHDPGALEFCKRVRFEFAVPMENVLCVGDEVDQYWASRFDKAADAPHTANQELDESIKELQRWAVAFPHMRICDSNHGARWAKRASSSGIPSRLLKSYREVLGTPETWQWADHWIVKASKQTFRVEHGHKKPGGHSGLRTRPLFRGMSTAWGHEHAEPATIHLDTSGQQVWGMRVGSLISKEPVPAFEYNAEDSYRPTASVGVVLDGGRLPLVVRM